jgi:hypothetical protein
LLALIGAGLLFSDGTDAGAVAFGFPDESRMVKSCLDQ